MPRKFPSRRRPLKGSTRLLEKAIVTLLSAKDYVPLDLQGLIRDLGLSRKDLNLLQAALEKLMDEGAITLIKENRYCIPQDAALITGTIRFSTNGSAILIPDQEGAAVLDIAAEDTGVALHEDRVLVRPKPLSRNERWKLQRKDRREPGQVIRILKRAREKLTGTFQMQRNVAFVIPDEPKITQDILIPHPCETKDKECPNIGDKVVVQLVEWKNRHLNPVGELLEILGKSHTPEAEFLGILTKYGLSPDFPEAALKQAETAAKTGNKAEALKHRMDCRGLFTLTIDPLDAKDFDDALSFEELSDGNWRIGVHIADVAHFVEPATALDKEAEKRGNSTYLVGTVIPMLPHVLSSGICSLVEGEDRLTKSVFFTFNPKGQLLETLWANTVIRSFKRLSYEQAFAFLKEDDLAVLRNLPSPPEYQTGYAGKALHTLPDEALAKIRTVLRNFWQIAKNLRNNRMKKGSLDLEMPEVKIYVDKEGYADRIEHTVYDESHQLIEEFMLLTNETIAKGFFEAKMAFLSRVHDEPDPEKLDEYREFLKLFGIYVGDLNSKQEVVKLLATIKDHPQGYPLRLQLLKSLKQAVYRPKTDGHYGLNKTFYTHFTSPIRRYTDLVNHRLFDFYLQKNGNETALEGLPKLHYTQGILTTLGEHLSQTERLSAEAERESVKIKLLEFFEREAKKNIKQLFKAKIVDVKNIGLFVELEDSLAFGLIHISWLTDDLYALSGDGTALVGRKSKKRYSLGGTVEVSVKKVDRFKRQIDFVIPEMPTSERKTAFRQRQTSIKKKDTKPKKIVEKTEPKKSKRKR